MDKLQWFKFCPSDWMMGKIQRCSDTAKGRFMNLCCVYWNKECELSYEDAEIEMDEEPLKELVKRKIVIIEGDNIMIKFLDEQYDEVLKTSDKRRDAANKRWSKKNAVEVQDNASALQTDADKSKIRVDLDKEKIRIDKEKNTILLSELSDESGLSENEKVAYGFWSLFKSNLQETGISNTKHLDNATLDKWTNVIRLMVDTDKRTLEELRVVWHFLKENQFWKKNIQSVNKLRDQFEKLFMASKEKPSSESKGELNSDHKELIKEIANR